MNDASILQMELNFIYNIFANFRAPFVRRIAIILQYELDFVWGLPREPRPHKLAQGIYSKSVVHLSISIGDSAICNALHLNQFSGIAICSATYTNALKRIEIARHVFMRMYACMHACTHVCAYARMRGCAYAWMHGCMLQQ